MILIDPSYILACASESYKNAGISKSAYKKIKRWIRKSPTVEAILQAVSKADKVDTVSFNDYMEILNERNAAISALVGKCEYCKYVMRDKDFDVCHICCLSAAHKYWEWRGVQDDTK